MKKKLSVGVLLVLLTINAFSQLSTSSLVGTVSTADGLLPGAAVTVKDNKTGKEVTVTSGNDGGFRVPNLEIGEYTVTIAATGFKTFTAQQVRLEIGKDYNLTASLEVGAAAETVTVTAGTDIVNSTDAQQNGIISNRQIEELPLLTRNPLGFIPLQAGVASNPSQNSTINGIRTSATNITIEGVNVQDNFIRSNATDFSPARPLVDEVEEFTVTGQANADRGFGAGQIQFPIRRGGNQYTGSVYEYNRNEKFGARNFFEGTRARLNRNDFGGRFQGPLPFLNFGDGGPSAISGKDRLFFFVFYQKALLVNPANDLLTTLTSNARNGLFTYTAAANDPANGVVAGQQVTVNLLNPALGTGITAINPIIQNQILSLLPAGNTTEAGDQRVTTGYRFFQNTNTEQTNYSTRIDYKVNDRNAIKGIFRYVYQTIQRSDVDTSFNRNPLVDQPSRNPFISLGLVSNFTDNFSNELNGGYYYSNPIFARNQAAPSAFILPPVVSNVNLFTNPNLTFLDQGRRTQTTSIQDNATFVTGNHAVRFGAQFQASHIDSFNFAASVPSYTLGVGTNTPQISTAQFTSTALFPGTVPTAQRANANALLALLGGIVSAGTQTFNATSQTSGYQAGAPNERKFQNNIYGLYVADQWRARPSLTLNFGLRYDIYGALKNPQGLFFEPIIAEGTDPVAALLNPNGAYQFIGGNSGTANTFYKTDRNNFAPNVSFAYTPDFGGSLGKYLLGGNKTVIRGGYRISYINDELVTSANNAGVGNAGLSTAVAAVNPLTNTTSLNARVNNLPTINAPAFLTNRTFATNNTAAFNFFGTVYGIDPNLKTPLVQEYSLGIQREIGFNTVLEARYVGTRSNNLTRAIDLNQIDIRSNGFLADFNRARANLVLTGNAACTTAGCQALTVFPSLASGGLLTNSTITGQLIAGTPADLALIYIQNGLAGNVRFLPNPGTGVVDYLSNNGKFRYNSLQVEARRRFTNGFQLQANYTFAKNLTNSNGAQTNATGDTQNRFDPQLDNSNPGLEFGRALFDQTHKLNINGIYQLPFGEGRTFFNHGGIVNSLIGGFTFSSILQIGSGAPISFNDIRGTLNRAGRSNRQTALTNLTKQELKDLVGIYRTPNGIFFLPPTVLGRNADGTINSSGGGTGRGSNGFGQPTFTGQVFFNNAPGQTSGLERSVVNGPTFYNLDVSLIKRFAIGERRSIQVQGDAFNVLNTTNFVLGQSQDINSTNFGRITGSFQARVLQLSARLNF